ncbi:hypothetical protein ABVF61_08845 [Roseibium sp. HPY-6]|uniref:hypothetical protein n=1 Tax=Roseibium sp. HPY-6 TaxID=3229852 RepID=UPI00338F8C6D
MLDLFAQSMFLATRITPLERSTGRLGQHTASQSKTEDANRKPGQQKDPHTTAARWSTHSSTSDSASDSAEGDI